MNQYGRRIFYDNRTGLVLRDTGESVGNVQRTTIEQDIEVYPDLSERNRDTLGVLELEYGQYAQDFATCIGFRVDLETKQLLFSYPDPNEPEEPTVYRPPLTAEVDQLNEQIAALMIDSAAKDIQIQQQDEIIADLMLQVAALQTASGGGGA